jgi:imidazolonepropionase-like amidohydrolase
VPPVESVTALGLLKMWTETTAQTIFPSRKIGELREGYEASFVALEGNPLDDLTNLHRIKLRFKQGMPVQFSN